MTVTTPFFATTATATFSHLNDTFFELYPNARIGHDVTSIFPKWTSPKSHQVVADLEGDMVQLDQIDDSTLGDIYIVRRAGADLLRMDLYSDIIGAILEFGDQLRAPPDLVSGLGDRQYTADQKSKIDKLLAQYNMLHHFTANVVMMSKVVERKLPARATVSLVSFADRVNAYARCRGTVITPLVFVQPTINTVELALFRVLIAMCWRVRPKCNLVWSTKTSGESNMLVINLIASPEVVGEVGADVPVAGSTDHALIQLVVAEMGWVYHIRTHEKVHEQIFAIPIT